MINLLEIVLFFLLPANIILLVLFRYKINNLLDYFSILIISYGIGPLMNGLLFYYLIMLFPQRDNLFYLSVIFSFWIIITLCCAKNLKNLISLYKDTSKIVKKNINLKKLLYIIPVVFFLFIYIFQIFGYPIIESDSAYYINQSKALYENKSLNYEGKITRIGGNDDYVYNNMIRPGIPSLVTLGFSLENNSNNYFTYNFLIVFYHILLLLLFLLLIKELAIKLKKALFPSLFFGSLFFIFSWTLTRGVILGAKESIIYYLALASIFVVYKLLKLEKRSILLEILLGILIGLNTFINLHGIIIGLILFLILFLFSKLKLSERIKQIFLIFIIHLFFGSFEFFANFKGIFLPILAPLFEKMKLNLSNLTFLKKSESIDSEVLRIIGIGENTKTLHENLYQFENIRDMYVKGKFQILTNIGMFGFEAWIFLLIIFRKTKEITNSKLGKLIIFFICVYFFIVIDPLNINKHPLAIVLWGSTKYASLILLLSMIITSVYIWPFLNKIFYFIEKESNKILFSISIILVFSLFFKNTLINFGLELLKLTVTFYKNIEFYRNRVSVFFVCFIILLISYLIVCMLIRTEKLKMAKNIFILSFISLFILVPFFITVVGKVPLEKTFSYINESNRDKLLSVSNYSDKYDVYFYAKDHLSKDSFIKTAISELYIYDDYFQLTRRDLDLPHYEISADCNSDILYSKGNINLCSYN